MKPHFRLLSFVFSLLPFVLLSCSDDKDDGPYPSIVSEMADCPTNSEGTMVKIVLDDDTELPLSNPQTDLKPNVTYRALAGFALDNGKVRLYSLKSATLLRDSTSVAQCDPVNVTSIWRTRRYINLHLLPKTQGGEQSWGFITDSIVGNRAYLRLHHRQGTDPTSYSTDVYASLPLKLLEANQYTIRINTFSGTKEFSFPQ